MIPTWVCLLASSSRVACLIVLRLSGAKKAKKTPVALDVEVLPYFDIEHPAATMATNLWFGFFLLHASGHSKWSHDCECRRVPVIAWSQPISSILNWAILTTASNLVFPVSTRLVTE